MVFDPLDGSSNIDVNVSVGTMFSILRRSGVPMNGDPLKAALQPGYKQVAAGYVVYGSSTIFVYTAGHGVYGFTLDPGHRRVCPEPGKHAMPRRGHIIRRMKLLLPFP